MSIWVRSGRGESGPGYKAKYLGPRSPLSNLDLIKSGLIGHKAASEVDDGGLEVDLHPLLGFRAPLQAANVKNAGRHGDSRRAFGVTISLASPFLSKGRNGEASEERNESDADFISSCQICKAVMVSL